VIGEVGEGVTLASGGATADAAALHQPWATIVLSGAATGDQPASNLRAETLTIDPHPMEMPGSAQHSVLE
jgi:aryl-alcohol dehydrogenase-like predicted oxidoreductase